MVVKEELEKGPMLNEGVFDFVKRIYDKAKNWLSNFWDKVKNLEFFSATKNNILRIVIPPSECTQLLFQLSNKFKYFLDWGGALIWLEAHNLSEEMFESIRKKVVKLGGYVTMIKNSDYLPYVEEVFTINRDRFNISQNIKKSFDPKGILNPGKMYTLSLIHI